MKERVFLRNPPCKRDPRTKTNEERSVAEVVGTGPGAREEAVSADSRGLLSTSPL